jgi:hypothetical protein
VPNQRPVADAYALVRDLPGERTAAAAVRLLSHWREKLQVRRVFAYGTCPV